MDHLLSKKKREGTASLEFIRDEKYKHLGADGTYSWLNQENFPSYSYHFLEFK